MRELIKTLLVWTICFAMITAGVILTYRWYVNRGPIITISFDNAIGLVPHQSKLIYHGVDVGSVEDIKLDTKTGKAMVIARLRQDSVPLIGKDSKFWLVKPELSFEKISNLSAISTGNYIAVEPVSGEFAAFFNAIDTPINEPSADVELNIILRTSNLGGIGISSPILYRGLKIGEIIRIQIAKNKNFIDIHAAIYEDYGPLIKKNSTFTNSSGFHADFSLFGGAHISMQSLRSLLIGGISLHTYNFNAANAKDGDIFNLLPEQKKSGC